MPRRDPSEKTKSEILRVASRLFREKGWSNVNIEDVVKEIGVTRGAFYHYFKSREDLIFAVMVNRVLVEDNVFESTIKEQGLNALEKLRLALKRSLGHQLDLALDSGDMRKTMSDPVVFKSNVLFNIYGCAPSLEKFFVEGNKDGSMPVAYPKHAAQLAALVFDEWVNPAIMQMSPEEFSERLSFIELFCERMGMPVLDDELREMLWKQFEHCRQK